MKNEVGVAIDVSLSLSDIWERAALAEERGASSIWLNQVPNKRDAGLLLAGLAANTHSVRLGTAVLPVYAHPPVVTAQTALTLDELSGHRLIVGLGVGHRLIGEWMLGSKYLPNVNSMREYLTILRALIQDGEVNFSGRWYSGRATYSAPRREALPVYLGSSGPRMLELAGELADGVILWLCTPTYLRDHVMPHLRAGLARRAGGKEKFAVVAMMFAALTPEPAEERAAFRSVLAGYQHMENYRRLLAASGFSADVRAASTGDALIGELAAIGNEQDVRHQAAAYRDAGATEIMVFPMEGEHFDAGRYVATLQAAAAG